MTKRSIPPEDQNGPDDDLFTPLPAEAEGEKAYPEPKPEAAPDPFDPESLRLGQDFASLGVNKALTVVRCRKPGRQEFVRVRPGEQWRLETAAFEDKQLRETYLVDRSLWSELGAEIVPVCLLLATTRQNDVFLWPVKLPGPDGRPNDWNQSAIEAAKLAETRWIRMVANMAAGMYDCFVASGELADPEWPPLSFHEILRLSFKDRFIRSADHLILRQLRGEA